ncbi:HIT domain-containing protein [Chlamydiales bacterium]|nr:HIT domain-containing protein [Chlamydiales bacterium]
MKNYLSLKSLIILTLFISASSDCDQPVLINHHLSVVVPEKPINSTELDITTLNDKPYLEWTEADHLEAFELKKKTIWHWYTKGYTDWLTYGKIEDDPFHWKMIPYSKEGIRFFKQFNVLLRLHTGGTKLPEETHANIVSNTKNALDEIQVPTICFDRSLKGKDPFCNPEVIKKQLIYEGELTYLLYNYAPLGVDKEQLHFVITPKECRTSFLEIMPEEYLEMEQIAQKVMRLYQSENHEMTYLFDKNGVEAGQSIPHFHKHLIFVHLEKNDWKAKLQMVKSMLLGTTPLTDEELFKRVTKLREKLSHL